MGIIASNTPETDIALPRSSFDTIFVVNDRSTTFVTPLSALNATPVILF